MSCMDCYNLVESKIGNLFAKHGRLVGRHPWKFILVGIAVNLLLGIGLLRLNILQDAVAIFTPINNRALQDTETLKQIFPDLSNRNFQRLHLLERTSFAAIVVTSSEGGTSRDDRNVLKDDVLKEVKLLYDFVVSISINYDGREVPLKDICAIQNEACSVEGNLVFTPEFRAAVMANNVPFPYFPHPVLGNIYYKGSIGTPTTEANGTKLVSAEAILLQFSLRTDTPIQVDMAKEWEIEFLKRIKTFSSEAIAISYVHSFSFDEELDANIRGDISSFAITIVVMIAYACLATYTARHDNVGQRMLIGISGVLAAGLSLVSSFGLVCACGLDFVSLVGVVPFLLIGIGIDDVFILLAGLTHAPYGLTTEDRIGEMMRTSGVAITITSLTDFLAFAAGASSVFVAVRNFCVYTAVAVLFCYINQITIFAGCIAVNENRMNDNRHFFSCRRTRTKRELKEEGFSAGHIFCCAGQTPYREKDSESFLDRLPKWLFPKLVSPMPMKVIILLGFAAYIGVSVWGITMMEEGLVLSEVVHESSYFYKFQRQNEAHFPGETIISFTIKEPITYSALETQDHIKDLVTKAQSYASIMDNFEINWLNRYKASSYYSERSEASFIQGLNTFMLEPVNRRYENDVVIDTSANVIKGSRVYVVSENIKSSQDNAQMMLDMRSVAEESPLPCFPFAPIFVEFEQYVIILSQTLQTMGIAIAMVFFVTFLFMPHPLLLFYVIVTVAMITVGIFGFLAHVDLALSSVTMISVIMSIGFSVDFTTHVCHSYISAKHPTRAQKVNTAIRQAGAPVFHGAVSSILGVTVLSFADSFIYRAFFKVMLLVITFGIAHAVLFLPVILSLFGPLSSSKETEVEPKSEQYKSPVKTPNVNGFVKDKEFDRHNKSNGVLVNQEIAESNEEESNLYDYGTDNYGFENKERGKVSKGTGNLMSNGHPGNKFYSNWLNMAGEVGSGNGRAGNDFDGIDTTDREDFISAWDFAGRNVNAMGDRHDYTRYKGDSENDRHYKIRKGEEDKPDRRRKTKRKKPISPKNDSNGLFAVTFNGEMPSHGNVMFEGGRIYTLPELQREFFHYDVHSNPYVFPPYNDSGRYNNIYSYVPSSDMGYNYTRTPLGYDRRYRTGQATYPYVQETEGEIAYYRHPYQHQYPMDTTGTYVGGIDESYRLHAARKPVVHRY